MTERFDHDALRELVQLHAACALGGPDRAMVETHLAECADCAAEYRALTPVRAALAQAVPQVDPPLALRQAILAAARRERPSGRAPRPLTPWLAAAAMLAISAGLGIYVRALQERIYVLEGELREALVRVDDGERRIAVAVRAAAEAQAPLAILIAPDVRRIDLAGQPAAPAASARAFWSRSRGLVITGSNLPPLPAGRIYQLWFVTAQAPVSAGLLTPDSRGRLTTTLNTPADLLEPVALAVTLEPEGGRPAPTGEKYLVGAAH